MAQLVTDGMKLATMLAGGQPAICVADSLGRVAAGYLADLVLVDGNPLEDITILQDRSRLLAIMKDGAFHKVPAAARLAAVS